MHDAIGIAQDIVVPEAQDAIASLLEPARAPRVFRLALRMLPAINFNDEACLGAEEIDDVRTDRLLAAEAKPAELTAAQA